MEDNMIKQEIDIYIIRGKITSYVALGSSAPDLIVTEEYTGDMLFLQGDECVTLNIQINESEYNLTEYISKELGDSNGIVFVSYITFSNKLDTINPLSIASKASKKYTEKIQYNSAKDFMSKFNNTMKGKFNGYSGRYMYMEISIHKNNL